MGLDTYEEGNAVCGQTPDGIIFLLTLIFFQSSPRYPPLHGAHWALTELGGYDRQPDHSHGGVYLLVVITGDLTVQGQISPVLLAHQCLQKIALFVNALHYHYH